MSKANINNLFQFALLTLVVGCGMPDKVDKSEVASVNAIACSERAALLRENESVTFHFNLGTDSGTLATTLASGDTLQYFSWGLVASVDAVTATYAAPSFVPETRKLTVEGVLPSGRSTPGKCFVHLLDQATYGVAEEANIRGLVVSTYKTDSITKLDSLSPTERGIIRNLDLRTVPTNTGLSGVTNSAPSPTTFYRVTGTLDVPGGNYWFRFTAPTNTGILSIDGSKYGNSGTGTSGTELPLRSTALSVTPNYVTGIPLTAGKHKIQIDLAHPAVAADFKLEWATKKPNGPGPNTTTPATPDAYTIIPPSAFDRD